MLRKKYEFQDVEVTVIVRKKAKKIAVPNADNDNLEQEFWSDEVRELYEKYLDK